MNRRGFFATVVGVFAAKKVPAAPRPLPSGENIEKLYRLTRQPFHFFGPIPGSGAKLLRGLMLDIDPASLPETKVPMVAQVFVDDTPVQRIPVRPGMLSVSFDAPVLIAEARSVRVSLERP